MTPCLASAGALRIAPQHRMLYNALAVLSGSFLIAALAQLEILLPFSPVPITGQTFAILIVGMVLGPVRGSMAVLVYLAEGAAGLPVFAGGAAGFLYLFGPTGGYLIGFVFAAALAGWLAERGWDRHVVTTLLAMTLSTAVIFVCGLLWLKALLPGADVLLLGLYPFLPGAVLKIAAATALLPALRKAF